jgi:hypothetical protein
MPVRRRNQPQQPIRAEPQPVSDTPRNPEMRSHTSTLKLRINQTAEKRRVGRFAVGVLGHVRLLVSGKMPPHAEGVKRNEVIVMAKCHFFGR